MSAIEATEEMNSDQMVKSIYQRKLLHDALLEELEQVKVSSLLLSYFRASLQISGRMLNCSQTTLFLSFFLYPLL